MGSCNNEDNSVSKKTEEQNSSIKSARVDEIVNFKNYLLQNNLIEHPDFINLEKSSTELIDGVEVINLTEISSDKTQLNIYRGIKTSTKGKLLIPNYKEYLIVQERYTEIDTLKKSYKAKKFDLNHSKFKFQEAHLFEGNVLVDAVYDLGLGSVTTKGGKLPSDCTGGKDSDLSWGECMNCAKTVCKQDPTCDSICDAVSTLAFIAQVLGTGGVDCNSALSVGCVGAAIAN